MAGMVYLHPITATRIQGSSLKSLQLFKAICGSQSFHACLLATTHWEHFDEIRDPESHEKARNRQQELVDNISLWGDMVNEGASVASISVNEHLPLALIEDLVDQAHSVQLALQYQLSKADSSLADTDAGKLVFEHTILSLASLREELSVVMAEIDATRDEQHQRAMSQLQGLAEDLHRSIDARQAQLTELQHQQSAVYQEAMQQLADQRKTLLNVLEVRQQNDQNYQRVLRQLSLQKLSAERHHEEEHKVFGGGWVQVNDFANRRDSAPGPATLAPRHPRVDRRPSVEQISSSSGRHKSTRHGSSRAERVSAVAGVASAVIGAAALATGCVVM